MFLRQYSLCSSFYLHILYFIIPLCLTFEVELKILATIVSSSDGFWHLFKTDKEYIICKNDVDLIYFSL